MELYATVISVKGYNFENLNNVRRNLILSTLRATKISLLVIAICLIMKCVIYWRYKFGV